METNAGDGVGDGGKELDGVGILGTELVLGRDVEA